MGHTLLDDGTGREITSPIGIGGVASKEPHIVPLGTNNKGELGLVVGSTDGSSSHSELLEFLSTGQLATWCIQKDKLTRQRERIDLPKHRLGT
jgi:hypothetical protein